MHERKSFPTHKNQLDPTRAEGSHKFYRTQVNWLNKLCIGRWYGQRCWGKHLERQSDDLRDGDTPGKRTPTGLSLSNAQNNWILLHTLTILEQLVGYQRKYHEQTNRYYH